MCAKCVKVGGVGEGRADFRRREGEEMDKGKEEKGTEEGNRDIKRSRDKA